MHNTSIVPMTSTTFMTPILTPTAIDSTFASSSIQSIFETRSLATQSGSLIDTLISSGPTSTVNNSVTSSPTSTIESPSNNQTRTVQIANDGTTSKAYMLPLFTMLAFFFATV